VRHPGEVFGVLVYELLGDQLRDLDRNYANNAPRPSGVCGPQGPTRAGPANQHTDSPGERCGKPIGLIPVAQILKICWDVFSLVKNKFSDLSWPVDLFAEEG
jgi:hypothetical protein